MCLLLWSSNNKDSQSSSLKKLAVQWNNEWESGGKFHHLWVANETQCEHSCWRPLNYKEGLHKETFMSIPAPPLHNLVDVFRAPNKTKQVFATVVQHLAEPL